jgi:Fur family ferric uptake transcriptional regulator
MTDTGEVIEFCDPRIQTIKKTIEEIFDIEITNHSLYLYGVKKTPSRSYNRSTNKEEQL